MKELGIECGSPTDQITEDLGRVRTSLVLTFEGLRGFSGGEMVDRNRNGLT